MEYIVARSCFSLVEICIVGEYSLSANSREESTGEQGLTDGHSLAAGGVCVLPNQPINQLRQKNIVGGSTYLKGLSYEMDLAKRPL